MTRQTISILSIAVLSIMLIPAAAVASYTPDVDIEPVELVQFSAPEIQSETFVIPAIEPIITKETTKSIQQSMSETTTDQVTSAESTPTITRSTLIGVSKEEDLEKLDLIEKEIQNPITDIEMSRFLVNNGCSMTLTESVYQCLVNAKIYTLLIDIPKGGGVLITPGMRVQPASGTVFTPAEIYADLIGCILRSNQ